MKIQLYQTQFAVSEQEYVNYHDGKLSINDIPAKTAFAHVTKDIDIGSSPIPHIGEKVNDSLWPSDICEQKVVDVVFDYSEKICYITLEPFVMRKNSQLYTEFEKISELHGWKYHKMF